MGFANNTVSYITYRVGDSNLPPEELRTKILRGLTIGRIGGIDVDLGNDQAAGFAVFENPLDTEFSEQCVFFDPLVLFSFRVDKLVVPANTMRLYVNRRVQERLEATRRQHLPREERQELSDQVKLELLRRALPSITAVDVVWDLPNNVIRFYSTSASMNDAFQERFNQYLELKLQTMNAVGILESRLEERELVELWHLLPTSFLLGGPVRFTEQEIDEPCHPDDGETDNG